MLRDRKEIEHLKLVRIASGMGNKADKALLIEGSMLTVLGTRSSLAVTVIFFMTLPALIHNAMRQWKRIYRVTLHQTSLKCNVQTVHHC